MNEYVRYVFYSVLVLILRLIRLKNMLRGHVMLDGERIRWRSRHLLSLAEVAVAKRAEGQSGSLAVGDAMFTGTAGDPAHVNDEGP